MYLFKLMIKKILTLKIKMFNIKKCQMRFGCIIYKSGKFEGKNVIGKYTIFNISDLGYASYVGDNCILNNVKIGRFCSISSNVKVFMSSHPSDTFVSTHPAFFSIHRKGFKYINEDKFNENVVCLNGYSVNIGNDVWIGTNVIMKSGITIGDGAIIAAGAVVTKNIEPYTIVGGVPAKIIRKRFTDEQIDYLLKFKWWDKPIKWIEKNADFFQDITEFMEKDLK